MTKVGLEQGRHKCLDVTEIYRLSREEAYNAAGSCALCVDFVDFILNDQRIRAGRERWEQIPLVKEKELSRVLDQHNLYSRDRVMRSFDQVIKNTMAKLQPGQKMQLYSMGELLEARYPYAFAEVTQALKRGVNLEYIIGSDAAGNQRDIDLLRLNLSKIVGDGKVDKYLSVRYSHASVSGGLKDVYYFDESGIQTDRLVEIAYRLSEPYEGARRLWVRLDDESEREDLIRGLPSP